MKLLILEKGVKKRLGNILQKMLNMDRTMPTMRLGKRAFQSSTSTKLSCWMKFSQKAWNQRMTTAAAST